MCAHAHTRAHTTKCVGKTLRLKLTFQTIPLRTVPFQTLHFLTNYLWPYGSFQLTWSKPSPVTQRLHHLTFSYILHFHLAAWNIQKVNKWSTKNSLQLILLLKTASQLLKFYSATALTIIYSFSLVLVLENFTPSTASWYVSLHPLLSYYLFLSHYLFI